MPSATTGDTRPGRTGLWLSPQPLEIAPLLSLLEDSVPVQIVGHPCWHGRLRGRELHATVTGLGGEASRRTLQALLAALPCVSVLLVGVAGGLNPALRPGDVVVASQPAQWPGLGQGFPKGGAILGARGSASLRSEELEAKGERSFQVLSGCILTWDTPVLDATTRTSLHRSYGADCVDMETGHVAHVCAAHGVPFLAVRGISDLADGSPNPSVGDALARAAWHATLVAAEALMV